MMMSPRMRVVFHPPTEAEFSTLFRSIVLHKGGGFDSIQTFRPVSRYHQRGGGIFSTIANLAKSALPFLFRAIAPSAVQFTQDVVHDVSTGERGLKGSLKRRGVEALQGVGQRLFKGGGKKRKRKGVSKAAKRKNKNKKRKRASSCKKKTGDVFDLI